MAHLRNVCRGKHRYFHLFEVNTGTYTFFSFSRKQEKISSFDWNFGHYCAKIGHSHVFFRLKRLMFQKGASVFHDTVGTTLVKHEARFILESAAVLRNSREIKICLSAELATHKSFQLIRMVRISVNIGNSLYFVMSFQILHYCSWLLTMCYSCYSR